MRERDRQHPVHCVARARRGRHALFIAWCALAIGAAWADSPPGAARASAVSTTGSVRRTLETHAVPPLRMVREDGARVSLESELDDGRPVVVNFIYTSCTTICPLSSQEFSRLQQLLGAQRDRVHLVSISVDPEEDTPARLRAYARRFHAGGEWNFYTGSVESSERAQTALNVFRGNKLTHAPVTLLRERPGDDWVRLDGFATAEDMFAELRALESARAAGGTGTDSHGHEG
jgi:protein SCO1/2